MQWHEVHVAVHCEDKWLWDQVQPVLQQKLANGLQLAIGSVFAARCTHVRLIHCTPVYNAPHYQLRNQNRHKFPAEHVDTLRPRLFLATAFSGGVSSTSMSKNAQPRLPNSIEPLQKPLARTLLSPPTPPDNSKSIRTPTVATPPPADDHAKLQRHRVAPFCHVYIFSVDSIQKYRYILCLSAKCPRKSASY